MMRLVLELVFALLDLFSDASTLAANDGGRFVFIFIFTTSEEILDGT